MVWKVLPECRRRVSKTVEVRGLGVRTLRLPHSDIHGPFVQRKDGCFSRSGRRFESCTGHLAAGVAHPGPPCGHGLRWTTHKESRHATPRSMT